VGERQAEEEPQGEEQEAEEPRGEDHPSEQQPLNSRPCLALHEPGVEPDRRSPLVLQKLSQAAS